MQGLIFIISALMATQASAGHLGWKEAPKQAPKQQEAGFSEQGFVTSLSAYHRRIFLRMTESQRARAFFLTKQEGLKPEEAVECAGRDRPQTYPELQVVQRAPTK